MTTPGRFGCRAQNPTDILGSSIERRRFGQEVAGNTLTVMAAPPVHPYLAGGTP